MRIVVTGLGVVSPVGVGEVLFWQSLREGRSALLYDREGDSVGAPYTARVGDFGARQAISPGALRRMPRLSQMTVVAAKQILDSNALPYDSERVGVVVGTGLGTLGETLDFVTTYLQTGPETASPATFPVSVMNAPAGQLAVELKLRGVNSTVNHRDHSALSALGMACDLLQLGRAEMLLVAGIEELSAPVLHAYGRLGGTSRTPARPYSPDAEGLCPGEAVTILALEREEDARRRGAPIRAVLSGRGERGEMRPRVGWGHAARWPEAEEAMRRAIASAGLGPSQLDWVVGGGNGGRRDLRELETLRAACGGRLPPTSSFLGLTGESLSSSMMRVAAAVLAIEQQWLPPTWGLVTPPPGFDESLLVEGRPAEVRHVLVPSIAQGGADLAFVVSSPTAQ